MNARTEASGEPIDLVYERAQAKKLLSAVTLSYHCVIEIALSKSSGL
jgi:hypothetical protein